MSFLLLFNSQTNPLLGVAGTGQIGTIVARVSGTPIGVTGTGAASSPRSSAFTGVSATGLVYGPQPTLEFNFLTGVLDSSITFARASSATYYDIAGTLQIASTNAPRFDYDAITHVIKGLLIEEARTNLLTNSQVINSWSTKTDTTVTSNSTTSPDGTVNASLCTEGSA